MQFTVLYNTFHWGAYIYAYLAHLHSHYLLQSFPVYHLSPLQLLIEAKTF